jgi:NADH dehydrogenase
MEEKPFRYRDLGSAAYISRGKAVVSAGPLQVGGFIGWWIWLFIHIAFLTGYRNRLGAMLTWWLAFTRDVRRERTFTTQQIATLPDVFTSPLGRVGAVEPGPTVPAQPTGGSQSRPDEPRPAVPGTGTTPTAPQPRVAAPPRGVD